MSQIFEPKRPTPGTEYSPPTVFAAAIHLKGGFWIAYKIFWGDKKAMRGSKQEHTHKRESGPESNSSHDSF